MIFGDLNKEIGIPYPSRQSYGIGIGVFILGRFYNRLIEDQRPIIITIIQF